MANPINIDIYKPTERFSKKVQDYIKYRPSYPPAVVQLIQSKLSDEVTSSIADIGSGTGIFSSLLLQHSKVKTVYGVEPNKEMREAAEVFISDRERFVSISGTGEITTLPSKSCDAITCAQSFHWFDRMKAKKEFQRILKNGESYCFLIWNSRRNDLPFLAECEALQKKYCKEYEEVNHKNVDSKVLNNFFIPETWKLEEFDNSQVFDLEGLKGRLQSSSFWPQQEQPEYEPLMKEVDALFNKYQINGKVEFHYRTEVFYGKV